MKRVFKPPEEDRRSHEVDERRAGSTAEIGAALQ